MRNYSVTIGGIIVALIAFGASIFSFHGLLDLRKFSQQIEATQKRVDEIEETNRKIRRQVDLIKDLDPKILEHSLRELHGFAEPHERIYIEK